MTWDAKNRGGEGGLKRKIIVGWVGPANEGILNSKKKKGRGGGEKKMRKIRESGRRNHAERKKKADVTNGEKRKGNLKG